jgi:hypothetical protein
VSGESVGRAFGEQVDGSDCWIILSLYLVHRRWPTKVSGTNSYGEWKIVETLEVYEGYQCMNMLIHRAFSLTNRVSCKAVICTVFVSNEAL